MNKNKYLHVSHQCRTLLLAGAALPALLWTNSARAQPPARVARIGLLSPFSSANAGPWHEAFRLGLRDLGWVEGKNISIEYRYADGKVERLEQLAAGLSDLKVNVIVVSVQTDALAAQKVIRTIPVIMASPGDPVAIGLVASLARPGGNITGLTQMAPELSGKRLELLKDMVPKLSRVAVLWNPTGGTSPFSWKELQAPARQLGLQLQSLEVSTADEFDAAFAAMTKASPGALLVFSNPLMITHMKRIVDFAAKSRIPSMYQFSEYVEAGGLVAYGPDRDDMFRRAATFVDEILKGAKPADLPVEQPTIFELVINGKTAKALGLAIPQALLISANQVIE
jgi:putative tryptophan/tyrosine transport system substrate-binding protein